ncbi:MAG: TolC family protein [Desulfobulbaceae bacterium]|nr:TolC family protein [Desulfobulbaceae bacterium]
MPVPLPRAAILAWLVLTIFLSLSAARAQDQPAGGGQEVDRLVSEALERNPDLRGNAARWEAFIQQARQADALDDPMLMLRAQNLLIRDPLAFDREVMTSKVVGISQMVPFFGKRGLKREAAQQDAEQARWELEERKVELTRMVKEGWYRLLFIDRSLEIVEKNIVILDDLSRFAETVYGVGRGLQQDVLKAQLERSKMEEMRISLLQNRRSLEAALNNLRFTPADEPIIPAAPLTLTPVRVDAATLEELAAANRPLLKGIAAREQKAAAEKELAEKEFYPDFTFSVEYMQREPVMGSEGYDMYAAGVTFNLPVQRERRHAMVAEAGAEIGMARAEHDAAANRIRLDIADGLARLERNRRLAELYRDGIIPQADHSLAAATAAYRAGTADFMNVLDSRMALFNYEREYIEAVAGYQMQLAVLEAVVGTGLDQAITGEQPAAADPPQTPDQEHRAAP